MGIKERECKERIIESRMRGLILIRTLTAHVYLKLAIGRPAQILWDLKKRIDRMKKSKKEKISEKEPVFWLRSQNLNRVEIKSREGLRLTGHFLEHPEAERIVLMFHGWRGKWDQDGAALARAFYREKCSVLLVDQRAHKTSRGKYIGFGVLERYDCMKWLEYLMKNTESLPVYLAGVSMGASTVLMTAGLQLPERVAGIIADCGFTSPYEMISIFAEKKLRVKSNDMADAVNRLCGKKAGYDLKEYSTLEAMKICSVPVFFAHGTGDAFVPCEMTVRNYEACTGKKRLFLAEGAVHTGSYRAEPKKYMEELMNFFEWN